MWHEYADQSFWCGAVDKARLWCVDRVWNSLEAKGGLFSARERGSPFSRPLAQN